MARRLLRRWWAAALTGALLLCCVLASALAEGDGRALEIEFTVRPGMMVSPGDITMTFVLTNGTDRAVQNIYLASSDGQLSEPLGQLGPGESETIVRPHTVTEAELDAGSVDYVISHDPQDARGEKVTYALSAPIERGDARPDVDFTRQLSSDSVVRGGLVTLTYKITNTGNVALSGLRIRDTLGDFVGRLEQLDVGESKTFISRVALSEAAESSPELRYTAPSAEDLTLTLSPALIRIADSALELSFSVGRSVFEKDTADAVLILTNGGNVDYRNITVLDDVYGGVIADAVALPAGGSPVEVAWTYPLRGEGQYRWHITGISGAGEKLDLRTDTLTVADAASEGAVEIEVEAQARTPRINRPGRVDFDFTIYNRGDAIAGDALLYEIDRGEVRRLAALPPGDPIRLTTRYRVQGDETFVFCLNYVDAQGRQRTVSPAPVEVEIAPDGIDPALAESAETALRGEAMKPGNSATAFVVLLIIAVAALTVLITILAVASLRARRERVQRAAAGKKRQKTEAARGASPAARKPETGKKAKKPAQ